MQETAELGARMMTTREKLLTAEEFFCLPDNGMRQELIDGKVIDMPPPGQEHGGTSGDVAGYLWSYVTPRGLGRVLTNDSGVVLRRSPDTVLGPDVCFIAAERLPGGRRPVGYGEIVPDLIVEIVTPSDRPVAVRRKTQLWLEAGARLVWVLYPSTRTVVISQPGVAERTLKAGDVLSGKPVLPGFSVPVAALFGP
jgi:Uma2 family endonuclease